MGWARAEEIDSEWVEGEDHSLSLLQQGRHLPLVLHIAIPSSFTLKRKGVLYSWKVFEG